VVEDKGFDHPLLTVVQLADFLRPLELTATSNGATDGAEFKARHGFEQLPRRQYIQLAPSKLDTKGPPELLS
jgi:hypothetical protein